MGEAMLTRVLGAGLGLALSLVANGAAASPLDLSNRQPRWVAVAFEVSPADRPAQRRTRYTRPLRAWLEPGAKPEEIRVRIDGALMERHVLVEDSPAPGSFGDFTWIFDAHTGHVLRAELSGAVVREIDWGVASWTTEARVAVRMSTHAPVAFRVSNVLGERVHPVCEPPHESECTVVEPAPLDPATGYVNAVGSILADSGPLEIESFSPLGEAVFIELDPVLAADDTQAPRAD